MTLPVVDLGLIACGDSSELFEFVDRAFDGVAFLVSFGVERGWASAGGAAFAAVGLLVGAFGGGGGDPASAEVGADRLDGVNNGLNILNVPIAEQLMAEGLVIVAAVGLDQFVRREDR